MSDVRSEQGPLGCGSRYTSAGWLGSGSRPWGLCWVCLVLWDLQLGTGLDSED